MHKLAPTTVLAALLGLAAFSTAAETIQLNDGEKSELRAKADTYRQEARNDRTMTSDVRGTTHRTATKTKKATHKGVKKTSKAKQPSAKKTSKATHRKAAKTHSTTHRAKDKVTQ